MLSIYLDRLHFCIAVTFSSIFDVYRVAFYLICLPPIVSTTLHLAMYVSDYIKILRKHYAYI